MRTLLFTCGLLAFVHLPGQDTTLTFPERKNLVKLGLSSGFVSIISLNYERVFNDRISAAMTVSWMVPRRPEGLLDLHTDNLDLSSGRELTGWYFTPEVKWYLELNGDGQLLDDLSQALEDAIGREVMPFDIELEKSGTTRVDHGGLGYRFGFKIGYAF